MFKCSGAEVFRNTEVSESNVTMKLLTDEIYNFSHSGIMNANGMTEDFLMIFKLENEKVKSAYLITKKPNRVSAVMV